MISRIQKIIQLKKLSASAFADKVGVPRSTISHILSGRNNPSLEFVQKVLDTFPEIRTEWLIRGDGHMLKATTTLFPDEEFEIPRDLPLSPGKETEEKIIVSPFTDLEEQLVQREKISDRDQARSEISKPEEDNENSEGNKFQGKESASVVKNASNGDKDKLKTVRVLIFYADGTFSEHFPSA